MTGALPVLPGSGRTRGNPHYKPPHFIRNAFCNKQVIKYRQIEKNVFVVMLVTNHSAALCKNGCDIFEIYIHKLTW